ncbi:MAG: NAD-dependent epimerase/dehydratase family protein [Oscillochloridaceae bacterium umkhey_bin13]
MSITSYLITGGAGFIGSHMAEALLGAGHRVSVIDDLSTGRMINIAHLRSHPRFSFVRASISDPIVLDRLVSEADTVIHLAAAVGVQLIVERPVHTIETNITGTEAVLQAALRYGCRTLLASTSEVYGKGSKVPFSEEDDVLLGPTSRNRWSYAATKMIDEFLALAYHQEYGLDVVIARLFNTVGPRQSGRYGMVIPRFVRQALDNAPIEVYGDGTQSRCFCDVSDVVRALIALADHPEAAGRVVNVGSTNEITIMQLAERVKALTDSVSPITLVPYAQAYAPGFEDMQRRVPDLSRAQTLLGWSPRLDLDTILKRVIAYERSGGL